MYAACFPYPSHPGYILRVTGAVIVVSLRLVFPKGVHNQLAHKPVDFVAISFSIRGRYALIATCIFSGVSNVILAGAGQPTYVKAPTSLHGTFVWTTPPLFYILSITGASGTRLLILIRRTDKLARNTASCIYQLL